MTIFDGQFENLESLQRLIVPAEVSLTQAIATLLEENLMNVFVMEGDRFLGRFSQQDALALLQDPQCDRSQALGSVVRQDPQQPCWRQNSPPDWHQLIQKLQQGPQETLPVLDAEGHLVGSLLAQDVLCQGYPVQIDYQAPLSLEEQQLLQEKLISSYTKLQMLLSTMPDIVLEISIHNDEQLHVGLPSHDYSRINPDVNETIAAFFEPPYDQAFFGQIQRAWEQGCTIRYEYHLPPRDDSDNLNLQSQWFEARISPLPLPISAQEITMCALWVARDITARKRAEAILQNNTRELEERVQARTGQLRSINEMLRASIRTRQEAQEGLQRTSDRLRAILDAIPGIVCWVDDKECYQGVNSNFANLYGLVPEDFLGQDLRFPSQPSHQLADFMGEFMRDVAMSAGQIITLDIEESRLQYLVVAQKYDSSRAAIAVGIDITQRQQFEMALMEQQRLFQQIADTSPDILYVYEISSWQIIYINCQVEALIGYTPTTIAELGLSTVCERLHPEDVSQIGEPGDRLEQLNAGQLLECEYRLRGVDGHWHWIHSREIVLSRDAQGNPEQIVGIVQDVSDRKEAEIALRQLNQELETKVAQRTIALQRSELRFRSLFEQMAVGVAQVTLEGRWEFVNQKLCDLLGYSPQQLAQRTYLEMTDPEDLPPSEQAAQDLIEERCQTVALEKRFLHANGTAIWVHVTISLVRDESVEALDDIPEVAPYLVMVIQDITERKRAEAEVIKALQKERELIDLKSRFISMASHEFRTPLAVIKSCGQLLQRYEWTREEQLEQLHDIQSAVGHMTELLDDVLTLAKSESGTLTFNPTPLDICEFCHKLLRQLQNSIARDRQLSWEIPNEPVLLNGDEKLLRQIFTNLVSNALKYSSLEQPVYVHLVKYEQELVYCVKDEGIGIPPEDLPRLFESFHRAKNVGTIPGTGLGLAIVQRSVELHGGTLEVTSQVGVGTQICVHLPLS
ncbi:PAS domain S-box protein [Sodalinema gerasimenkoae]|uniref:PAS domain S-box protein n=1 Tax=Sodalinema gerasimenkoae TaxID=2862348 RepID=UPI00135BB630|nr:PAS domain S-box protein [Sodalinema gerasimenkoae]